MLELFAIVTVVIALFDAIWKRRVRKKARVGYAGSGRRAVSMDRGLRFLR